MKRSACEALGDAVGRLRKEPYNAASHVRFVVGDCSFHAHRWLIEARTEKYAHSMKAGFAESASNEWKLPNHSPEAFEQFLAFLYTDACEWLQPDDSEEAGDPPARLIDLWRLAEELIFPKLLVACKERFGGPADKRVERCPGILAAARRSGFPPAVDAAWEIIEKTFAGVKHFMEIDLDEKRDSPKWCWLVVEPLAAWSCIQLGQQVFHMDGTPPSDAEAIRFNELFLCRFPVGRVSLQLERAKSLAVLDSIPLHELSIVSLGYWSDTLPLGGPEIVARSIVRRVQYERKLATSPREVCRKPVDSPLEFMPLSPLRSWSKGIDTDYWTPSLLSCNRFNFRLSKCYAATGLFVADYPSVCFSVSIDESCSVDPAILCVGLLDAVSSATWTQVVVRISDDTGRIHIGPCTFLMYGDRALSVLVRRHPSDASAFAVVYAFNGKTVLVDVVRPTKPGIDTAMPFFKFEMTQPGTVSVIATGTRWSGERNPFQQPELLPVHSEQLPPDESPAAGEEDHSDT